MQDCLRAPNKRLRRWRKLSGSPASSWVAADPVFAVGVVAIGGASSCRWRGLPFPCPAGRAYGFQGTARGLSGSPTPDEDCVLVEDDLVAAAGSPGAKEVRSSGFRTRFAARCSKRCARHIARSERVKTTCCRYGLRGRGLTTVEGPHGKSHRQHKQRQHDAHYDADGETQPLRSDARDVTSLVGRWRAMSETRC